MSKEKNLIIASGFLTLILAGGEGCTLDNQGAGITPTTVPTSIKTIRPSIETSITIAPESTPDNFKLNQKTIEESAIFMVPTYANISKDYPLAYELYIHGFTIETRNKNADGSVTVELDTNGGPLIKHDQNSSVNNYDGSKTELFTYECDPMPNAANNLITITVLGKSVLSDGEGKRIDTTSTESLFDLLKPGEATVDFKVTLNGITATNIQGVEQLNELVGSKIQNLSFISNDLVLTNT